MLVLTRRINEAVDIGDGLIKITVFEAADGRCKLGIDAPRDIPIWRAELLEEKDCQQS